MPGAHPRQRHAVSTHDASTRTQTPKAARYLASSVRFDEGLFIHMVLSRSTYGRSGLTNNPMHACKNTVTDAKEGSGTPGTGGSARDSVIKLSLLVSSPQPAMMSGCTDGSEQRHRWRCYAVSVHELNVRRVALARCHAIAASGRLLATAAWPSLLCSIYVDGNLFAPAHRYVHCPLMFPLLRGRLLLRQNL